MNKTAFTGGLLCFFAIAVPGMAVDSSDPIAALKLLGKSQDAVKAMSGCPELGGSWIGDCESSTGSTFKRHLTISQPDCGKVLITLKYPNAKVTSEFSPGSTLVSTKDAPMERRLEGSGAWTITRGSGWLGTESGGGLLYTRTNIMSVRIAQDGEGNIVHMPDAVSAMASYEVPAQTKAPALQYRSHSYTSGISTTCNYERVKD